jgi:hypothetical protein
MAVSYHASNPCYLGESASHAGLAKQEQRVVKITISAIDGEGDGLLIIPIGKRMGLEIGSSGYFDNYPLALAPKLR